MFRHGCAPPSGAGADLLLSYYAFISLAGGSTRSMATGLSGSAFAAGLTLRDARTGKECGWEGKGVPYFWGLSVR